MYHFITPCSIPLHIRINLGCIFIAFHLISIQLYAVFTLHLITAVQHSNWVALDKVRFTP